MEGGPSGIQEAEGVPIDSLMSTDYQRSGDPTELE